jgi:hypothetical protein
VGVTERSRRTIGWTEAAFASSVLVRSSFRRSVTLDVRRKRTQLSGDGRQGGHRRRNAVQMALRHRLAVIWQENGWQENGGGQRNLSLHGLLIFLPA